MRYVKKKKTRKYDLYTETKIKFNQAIADHVNTATPLKIVPKRNENIKLHKTYIQVFIEALFILAKNYKQLKSSSYNRILLRNKQE